MNTTPDRPRKIESDSRLYDVLATWTRWKPDETVVAAPGVRLTWAMLKAAVDDSAAAMIAAGVTPGDRVAVLATPGPDFLISFLATAAIGGIWIGLNPRYAERELDAVIARITPRLVLVAAEIEGRDYSDWAVALPPAVTPVLFGPAKAERRALDHGAFLAAGATIPADRRQARQAAVRATDPCLIVFTSGSTGAPKGAVISQAALVGASRVQLQVWPAEPLRVLINLPINHIGCVGDLSCYALVGGGVLVFSPRFDAAGAVALIQKEQITVWGQVPTMFQLVLETPAFDASGLGSLQRIFWGGAHASPTLIARLRALCPQVATSYGQTETVGSVTFTTSEAGATALAESVGRVVPPYQLRIAAGGPDGDGSGEVEVRTPFGMLGYWDDLQGGAAPILPDAWRPTGDVGVLTADGDLKLLGRVHDVFKSGGYNIHPPEIETALESHPRVRQAAVVGAPDALYGAAVVAFIVCDGAPPSAAELHEHLARRLANYKSPKRYHVLESLPRLPVGKIDKRELLRLATTIGAPTSATSGT